MFSVICEIEKEFLTPSHWEMTHETYYSCRKELDANHDFIVIENNPDGDTLYGIEIRKNQKLLPDEIRLVSTDNFMIRCVGEKLYDITS